MGIGEQKKYEIDTRRNQKLIDENEAKRLKKEVADAVEYYSYIDCEYCCRQKSLRA